MVGRGSARAVALLARSEGARVVVAGRDKAKLAAAYDDPGISSEVWTSPKEYFEHISSRNPTRRIGTPDDIAGAVLFAMTNTFLTGVTLKVDGGEPLA